MRIVDLNGLFVGALVASIVVGCGGEETGEMDDDGAIADRVTAAPELVGPGTISTEANETFPAIDPRDGSLWLSIYEDAFDAQTIVVAERSASGWDAPEVAPFSGTQGDRAPRFAPDGDRLYFTSNRPVGEDSGSGDMNIWVVERDPDGAWSAPELVPPPVSSEDIHSSIASDGTIYVASNRPGGRGRSDIYRIAASAVGAAEAELLGPAINDSLSQPDLYVSPDESWMVLVITDGPAGLGGDDLYLVHAEETGWSEPENLGAPINSEAYEYGPTLSPDGRYLYYTSHRNGSAALPLRR